MILGVGVDLCRIVRIRRSIARFGKDWLDEIFTVEEQIRLGTGDQKAHRAAIAFAIKEASSKAIGTGFSSDIRLQDFVVSVAGDHCAVELTGAAADCVLRLCPIAASCFVRARYSATDQWVSALAVLATSDSHRSDLPYDVTLP